MNKDSILLLTKDAQCKAYYPCYGNTYWKGKTTNLDELVKKGTVFNHFYTAAPSSNMSYLSMFTMVYPYTREIKRYEHLTSDYDKETLFDKAKSLGFTSHILWDSSWDEDIPYARCFGGTTIHSIENLRQGVGAHYIHKEKLKADDVVASYTLERVKKEVASITKGDEKIFLWCHLPHVLNGRTGYGSDMDLYDEYIGMFREFFDDNNIFISADHGNMNGYKGKVGYGFDVYETAINIPLITPRINNQTTCNTNLSNVDFYDLIFNRSILSREIIYSDSAYFAQPNRKLCLIYGKYRYIYNKATKVEELYDVDWDPNQNFNLIEDDIYDVDRFVRTPSCEYYFYPFWEELPKVRQILRDDKNRIWRDVSQYYTMYKKIRRSAYSVYTKIRRLLK